MLRFLRAVLAGSAATLADLAVLALLVSVLHVDPRAANVPALVAGGIVNFLGNRHFAFRAAGGSLVKQAVGYGAVELVALGLNGVLYDLAMQMLHGHGHAPAFAYAAVRLVTSHLVFLLWSYPLWRLVFRTPVVRATA